MALLKLARMGHPVLRQAARPIPEDQLHSPALQRLIDDMVMTMREDQGIGLAAPQVFQPLRLAVLGDSTSTAADPDAIPLTILINPTWKYRSEEQMEGWEGCLSVPGLRGVVPRAAAVQLEALDRYGRPVHLEADGYFARVLQHEIDHLDGVLYLDRMPDMRRLTFMEEFSRYWIQPQEEGPADTPES